VIPLGAIAKNMKTLVIRPILESFGFPRLPRTLTMTMRNAFAVTAPVILLHPTVNAAPVGFVRDNVRFCKNPVTRAMAPRSGQVRVRLDIKSEAFRT
jgi:hypothetical protein